MDKVSGYLFLAIAIGGLIGAGGMYYYQQPQLEAQFAAGQAYGQSLTPSAVTPTAVAADLDFDWDDDDFDHSATVDAGGDVAADTDHTQTLTITCDEDGEDAEGVWISLQNPVTGEDGLDADLELDDVEVTFAFGALAGIDLYEDGDYTAGYEIGDIPAGAHTDIDITVTLLEHDDGDFPDGATLDCELYVYQPSSGNVDTVDFTVST